MKMNRFKENLKVQKISVLIGVFLLSIKFLAYYLTASNAILSDALESIINVVAGGLAVYSLYLASKPKDENHPYGHGKIEFLSAGFEGGLIAIAGSSILLKSSYNLFYPQEIHQLEIGLLLTAFAGLINYFVGFRLEKQGNETNSTTMQASGKHLKSDAYSSVGLLLGLGLAILTDLMWLDSLVAIVFGGFIFWTGFQLLRQSIAGIMDEADYPLIDKIVGVLEENRSENWIDVHNLRVIRYGAMLHIDCHLTLPWYFNVKEAHDEVERFETLINTYARYPVELFIHTDPCDAVACAICQKMDCPVRSTSFQQKVRWSSEIIMKNQRHQTLDS